MKNSTATFQKAKQNGKKITMLTCYDCAMAQVMDAAGINGLLVGDSLGNVVLGYKNTLPVTMDEMVHHAKAVVRGTADALVVVDMPFMSYQVSVADAVANAGRLIKETGAGAVKLEGGAAVCPQIAAITAADIPVMGHLGFTPQSIHAFGGYKVQGRDETAAQKILDDALAVAEAGAFALVLEMLPAALARRVTEAVPIPTIGIGAGNDCDGQILVCHDMLGLYPAAPAFVKKYADLGEAMRAAFAAYRDDVTTGAFPATEHTF